jgi:hypothetical protein
MVIGWALATLDDAIALAINNAIIGFMFLYIICYK